MSLFKLEEDRRLWGLDKELPSLYIGLGGLNHGPWSHEWQGEEEIGWKRRATGIKGKHAIAWRSIKGRKIKWLNYMNGTLLTWVSDANGLLERQLLLHAVVKKVIEHINEEFKNEF